MKKLLTLLTLLCCLCCAQAQKNDNNWLWGRQLDFQDSAQYRAGNAQADFSSDSMTTYSKFRNMPFTDCAGYFSDDEGNLLLYTNGMQIKDTTGNLITNGDSLNFGPLWIQAYQGMISGDIGYPMPRSVIFFRKPLSDSVIYLIHFQPGPASNSYDARIKLTTIVQEQSGLFKAEQKNEVISAYPAAFLNLAACKHGNGRDWWLFFTENNTNCVVKMLITPDSIIEFDRQCIGDTIADKCGIKSVFSLDGTKYASTDAIKNGTNIFDFDRCSGVLSNPKHIEPFVRYDTIFGAPTIVDYPWNFDLSPDGHLVYIMMSDMIFQFDLTSSQFPNDYDTVGIMDNYMDTSLRINYPFTFFSSTYGPDGVMYISPANTQRYLCTINNPNGKGTACDYRIRSKLLPKVWAHTAPNIPNYRLGRSLGSTCDTIYSDIKPIYQQTPWLKVYPNPATDVVRFDYNWVEWERIADCELRIADLQGRIVLQQKVPKYSTRQEINIKSLAAGVYTVSLYSGSPYRGSGGSGAIAVCKLVKE